MAEIIVLAVAFLGFCLTGLFVVKSFMKHSSRGFEEALTVSRETRYMLISRITTLENRLQSNNWQEFATLQQVPAESEKAAWSEQVHDQKGEPALYTPEQLEHLTRIINEGSDLEGTSFSEDMERSTIG